MKAPADNQRTRPKTMLNNAMPPEMTSDQYITWRNTSTL